MLTVKPKISIDKKVSP